MSAGRPNRQPMSGFGAPTRPGEFALVPDRLDGAQNPRGLAAQDASANPVAEVSRPKATAVGKLHDQLARQRIEPSSRDFGKVNTAAAFQKVREIMAARYESEMSRSRDRRQMTTCSPRRARQQMRRRPGMKTVGKYLAYASSAQQPPTKNRQSLVIRLPAKSRRHVLNN